MIRFENVTKSYKGSVVRIEKVSLEILKGESSPRGRLRNRARPPCSKLLLREEVADRGEIWVAGKEIGQLSNWRVPYLRRNLGSLFQDFRLLPEQTCRERGLRARGHRSAATRDGNNRCRRF